MSTDETTEQAIQSLGLNAARVTPDQIERAMQRVGYVSEARPMGSTSTLVHAFLDGTFYLASGHSACVSPANYDPVIGHNIALRQCQARTKDKLWELLGFQLYMAETTAVNPDPIPQPDNAYPLYESRKRVRAFQIGVILQGDVPGANDWRLLPVDGALPLHHVSHAWYCKHEPSVGGYVVFYADGYVSYSPAAPFDQSHVAVQP
ncbi:MAG: Gp49 family protein [Pseudomonadota bacterium]